MSDDVKIEDGEQRTFQSDALSLAFKPAHIATSGEVGLVRLFTAGQTVELTFAQARSLAKALLCNKQINPRRVGLDL